MELRKNLSRNEKIKRNFIFASLVGVVAVFLAKDDFAAAILLVVGFAYGIVVAQNFLKN